MLKTPLVGTVDIVGVDRESPKMRKAIERNRYMVFTSPDGRFLHWLQRKFSPPYTLAMRLMNRELDRAAR